MRKIKVGDVVVAKKRVGEVRRLFTSSGVDLAFVYFPYVHETDNMILSGYEQNQHMSDLRVATASEKKDFQRRKKELKKSEGADMSRRRFELIDPSENARKFWEVEVNGSEVTTFWGRIGATPTQNTKDFGTPERAESEAAKLVKEKTNKGYKAVSGSAKKGSAKKSGGKKASGEPCGDCAASPGELHESGCDLEECPKCGGQLLGCKHGEEILDDPDAHKRKPWPGHYGKAKKSGAKKSKKTKCAHCGDPSTSPTECPAHRDHTYNFAKGCKCAFCNEHFNKKLNSTEVNWLAKHGWSSAQIKAMKPAEARRHIEAGEHKKPGPETEAAAGPKYSIEEYQQEVLKTGIGVRVAKGALDKICLAADKLLKGGRALRSGTFACGLAVLGSSRFSSGKHDVLVVPADPKLLDSVFIVLQELAESSDAGFRKRVESVGTDLWNATVARLGKKWRD